MMGAAVLEITCASPCDDWATGSSFIPSGVEVHWLSGAAFLFVGALLVVESLAGRVWYRGYAGRLIWPAAVIAPRRCRLCHRLQASRYPRGPCAAERSLYR